MITSRTVEDLALFDRKILPNLIPFLHEEGILVLTGSRQVGKTSLMFLLIRHLLREGTPARNLFYIDLEDPAMLDRLNAGVQELLYFLESQEADLSEQNFVFLDEIQYLDHPSPFLKLIADHHPKIKLVVSGSSSFELKRKFRDSLSGRKVVFEILPLDFLEFLRFKGEDVLRRWVERYTITQMRSGGVQPDPHVLSFHSEALGRLFEEYAVFGGYPKTARMQSERAKIAYLTDVYQSYARKDIKDLAHIEHIGAFNRLLRILGLQIGQLANLHELTNTVGVSRETLQRYLFLLENTYVVKMLPPHFTNRRKELTKMSKVFFPDPGLRNAIVGNFDRLHERIDAGQVMENAVFSQLLKNLDPLEDVAFWRTHAKSEVDFILRGKTLVPLEVRYRPFRKPELPSGLRAFLNKYPSQAPAFVATKDFLGQTLVNGTMVWFVPCWLIG